MPRQRVERHPGMEWYYTIEELAELLGIKPNTVYTRLRRGTIVYQEQVDNRFYFSETYTAQKFREEQEKAQRYCKKDLCIYRASCLLTKRFYRNPKGCEKYERYTVEHRMRGVG